METHKYHVELNNGKEVLFETIEHHDDWPGQTFWTEVLKPALTSPMAAMAVNWKYMGKK